MLIRILPSLKLWQVAELVASTGYHLERHKVKDAFHHYLNSERPLTPDMRQWYVERGANARSKLT